ncbi:MAG: CvpA family protein [Pirellula sp.]|jgi:uncharacterized membrane protein required for colicin V production
MKNRKEEYEDLQPSSFPYFGIVLLFLLGAGMGHCWWVGDVIAIGALFVLLVGSLVGYFCGLWRSLASTVGMFIGYQFALPISVRLLPFLEGQIHQSIEPTIGIAISGLAAGSVATLGILWIGVFLRRNTMFRIVDQYAGGVAGLCSSVVGVALVFWVVLAAEPTIRQSREIADRNEMLSLGKDTRYVALIRLTEFIDATKKSYVMVGLRSWNPIVDVAHIRDLKKQIETSLDPARWNSETNGGILGSIPKLIRAPTTPPVQQPQAMDKAPALRGSFP